MSTILMWYTEFAKRDNGEPLKLHLLIVHCVETVSTEYDEALAGQVMSSQWLSKLTAHYIH
jgi:hypothetical protein